ncbi:unnamed protein product [Effrenium voratum]|nr:unnamed protein product [Effrenium voratum]
MLMDEVRDDRQLVGGLTHPKLQDFVKFHLERNLQITVSSSIPGFSVVDAAVASAPAEKEEVGSDVSTVDTDDDTEEINVHAWGSVGRKIFHTLADLSDDEFEVEPPIDVKSWSAVGARIRQSLVDLDEDEPSPEPTCP